VKENFKDVGCNNILETVNSDRSNCKINGTTNNSVHYRYGKDQNVVKYHYSIK